MNITRENIDELNGLIRVSIVKDDYESKVEQVLNDYRKKMNMPGFRPGKVPQGLVKKIYGKSALVEEVNKLLTEGLSKFIVDEKLEILGEPLPNESLQKKIDWDIDNEYEFVFDIGFTPEVKVSLDKRSKFPYYKIKVTDELIDQQIGSYCSRFGSNQPVDEVNEDVTIRGNIIQLDENDMGIENGISVEMALISVKQIKDEEIRIGFLGKKIDDEVIFDLKKAYPNNTEITYLLKIDKKEAEKIEGNFKITVKEINQFVPASVNEELYQKVFGEEAEVKDEKTFRLRVGEEIGKMFDPSSDYKFAIDAREALINKIKIKFPEEFLRRWLLAVNKELSKDQVDTEFDHFLKDLTWQVIRERIIGDNDLKVDEAEVMELARQIAAAQFHQYGMYDIPDEQLTSFAKHMLEKKEDRSNLYNRKMEDKVMDVIKWKVTLEENEVTKEEFDNLFDLQKK
jgi:trigger factor